MGKKMTSRAMLVLVNLFFCFSLGLEIRFTIRAAEATAFHTAGATAQPKPNQTLRGRNNGKLVFTSDRHNRALNIWTMNPDGSSPTRLTHPTARGPNLPPFVRVYDDLPVWSPDGTKIAFISNRDCGADSTNLDCLRTIYIMNADGSDLERILVDGIEERCRKYDR